MVTFFLWTMGAITLLLVIAAVLVSVFGRRPGNPPTRGNWNWSRLLPASMPTHKINEFVLVTVLVIATLYWFFDRGFRVPMAWFSFTTFLLIGLALAAYFHSPKWWIVFGLVLVVTLYQGGHRWSDLKFWSDSKETPGIGGNTSTTTIPVYKPGDVIFDGMTPCYPIIPCEYSLTPDGPIKLVFQTQTGTVAQRIRETAPNAPENRLWNRPVVITSLTAGTQYRVVIIAR